MIKHALHLYRELASGFRKGLFRFFKYQLITNLLFSILIIPCFMLATEAVLRGTDYPAVSNTMLFDFIFSGSGIAYLIMGAGIVLLGILLQLCGLIVISAQVKHDVPESSYSQLLMYTLKKLPRMFEIGTLLVFAYLLLIAPLTGSGLKLDFFETLEIPDFIMGVIDNSFGLTFISSLMMMLMTVCGFLMVFTFHFMILGNLKPSQAVKFSALMIIRNKWHFVKDVILVLVLIAGIFAVGEWTWSIATTSLIDQLDAAKSMSRAIVVFLLLLQHSGMILIGMLFIPFEIYHFTLMYYEFVEQDDLFQAFRDFSIKLPQKHKPSLIDCIFQKTPLFMSAVVVIMILISIPAGVFFNEIFRADYPVAVMAHRAGGVESLENSVPAALNSIQMGADWLEVDVQRTKDGIYVLYHDESMQRLDEDENLITEVTYDYIKQNQIKATTLESMLQACKGKVRLNIELKGAHADPQMVDDLVKMVQKYGLVNEVILTTQNYDLIVYMKHKYPKIKTGLIYFMSIGRISELEADYFIVEMREVTEALIDSIHQANKKIIVWTVNDADDMWDFTRMSVDGIITDEIKALKKVIDERDRESDEELMYNVFFY